MRYFGVATFSEVNVSLLAVLGRGGYFRTSSAHQCQCN